MLNGIFNQDSIKRDDWDRATLAAHVNIIDAAIDGSLIEGFLTRSDEE